MECNGKSDLQIYFFLFNSKCFFVYSYCFFFLQVLEVFSFEKLLQIILEEFFGVVSLPKKVSISPLLGDELYRRRGLGWVTPYRTHLKGFLFRVTPLDLPFSGEK